MIAPWLIFTTLIPALAVLAMLVMDRADRYAANRARRYVVEQIAAERIQRDSIRYINVRKP